MTFDFLTLGANPSAAPSTSASAVRRQAECGLLTCKRLAIALTCVAWITGCGDGDDGGPGKAAGAPAKSAQAADARKAASPAVLVTTVPAERRDFALVTRQVGTVTPINSVEVRPQLDGVIAAVHFQEGQTVRAGQLLFTLDARSADVAVAQARAQLTREQATLADAERQAARSRELAQQNFISQSAVDTTQSQAQAQRAVVAAAQAALKAAQVTLSYTRIVAPADGRVGVIRVRPGSLVQPSGEPLVVITQLAPITVSFRLPQANLDDVLGALERGGAQVQARLPGRSEPRRGQLQFVDSQVDAASGTVQVKAVFANEDQRLWPGAYVDVELVTRTVREAIVIPRAAIIQGLNQRQVYVLDDDGRAELREIEIVASVGDEAAVVGVEAGQQVVLDGRQNLRPGVAARVQDAATAAPR